MFYGLYEYTLDNKGRLCIPKKIKERCNGILYIMKGFEGALALYTADAFDSLAKEVETLDFNKKETRAFLRVRLSSVCELELDGHNRILIPTHLLNKYKIGKDVIMIGVGDHIEIWDKNAYEQYEDETNKNFEDIAEHLIRKEIDE